uniref:Uncharacterized protein n=1 Tax=Helianthus annuus TaxID=4232 RepID=A0A251SAA4_HELAN
MVWKVIILYNTNPSHSPSFHLLKPPLQSFGHHTSSTQSFAFPSINLSRTNPKLIYGHV